MRQIEREVIVVGSGPGGSMCAGYMAREGIDVLLLDKEFWPRDKPCADAQGGNTCKHIEALGAIDEHKSFAMRASTVMMASAKYEATYIPNDGLYISPRWEFDDLMRRTAIRHGAEMWQNCWVHGVYREDGYIRGVKARVNGEDLILRGKAGGYRMRTNE